MGAVVSLVEARDKQSLEVLRHYLIRAEQGKVRGLTLCVKDDDGKEEMVAVGDYRRDPSQGVNASVRMTIKLAALQDEHRPKSGWRPL